MKSIIKSVVVESMTIPFTISLVGRDEKQVQDAVQSLVKPVLEQLEQVNQRYSTFLDNSIVNDYRNGHRDLLERDAEFKFVYDQCQQANEITNGYFDATNDNGQYDPLGYVKGWAVESIFDQLMRPLLNDNEIEAACLNGGGDMQFASNGDFNWQIGIENPNNLNGLVASYQLKNGGMATSGNNKRGNHLRILGTDDLRQVTIYATDLTTADIWATAGMAAGELKFCRLIEEHRLTGCFVNSHNELSYFSQGVLTNVK